MKFLYKADMLLKKMNVIQFIFTMVLLTYIITFVFIPLFLIFDIEDMGGLSLDDLSPLLLFFLVVIISPIIETFLFETLFFWILLKINIFKERVFLVIILSAIVFGFFHGYSIMYIIIGFLGGIIFAYSYYVYMSKSYSSFLVVVSIHSIRNFLAFLVSYIFIY